MVMEYRRHSSYQVLDRLVIGIGNVEDVLDPLSEARDLGALEPDAAERMALAMWDRTPGLSVAITSMGVRALAGSSTNQAIGAPAPAPGSARLQLLLCLAHLDHGLERQHFGLTQAAS